MYMFKGLFMHSWYICKRLEEYVKYMPTFVTKLACVSRQTLTFPRLLITGLSMYTLTLMNTVRSVKSLITRWKRKTQQFQSSPTALEEYNTMYILRAFRTHISHRLFQWSHWCSYILLLYCHKGHHFDKSSGTDNWFHRTLLDKLKVNIKA